MIKKSIILLFLLSFNLAQAAITINENGNIGESIVVVQGDETKLVSVNVVSDSSDEVLKIVNIGNLIEDPSSQNCVKTLNNESCSLVFSVSKSDIGSKIIYVFSRENGLTTKKRMLLKIQTDVASGDYTEGEMSSSLSSSVGSLLNFGLVSSGEVFQKIYFKNIGSKNISQLDNVVILGKGFTKSGDTCSGKSLNKGESCSVSVFFDSSSLFSGIYQGSLTLKNLVDTTGFSLNLEAEATALRISNKPKLNFSLGKNFTPTECSSDPLILDKSACFYEADPIDSSEVQTSSVICNENSDCSVNLSYQQPNESVLFNINVHFKDNTAPAEVVSYIPNSGSLSVMTDFQDKFSTNLNTSKNISFTLTNNSAGSIALPVPSISYNSSIFSVDQSSSCLSVVLKLKQGESCSYILSLLDVSQANKIQDTIEISSGDSSTQNILDVTGFVLQPASETKYDNKVYFDSGAVFQ